MTVVKEWEHSTYIPISLPDLRPRALLSNILLPGSVTLRSPTVKEMWWKAGTWTESRRLEKGSILLGNALTVRIISIPQKHVSCILNVEKGRRKRIRNERRKRWSTKVMYRNIQVWQTREFMPPLQTVATTHLYPTAVTGKQVQSCQVLEFFKKSQKIWILMWHLLIFKCGQTNSNFKEQYAEWT